MSNRYLILGPNFKGRLVVNPKYRGIERIDTPDFPQNTASIQAINDSIKKYKQNIDLSIEDGQYLNNYKLASEIAKSFTLHNENGETYEVIQVIYPEEEPPKQVQFLGYDVISTNEYGSIIINFLNEETSNIKSEFIKHIELLNGSFLFGKLDVAEEFCHLASQRLGNKFVLKIVGIYLVTNWGGPVGFFNWLSTTLQIPSLNGKIS
jgi:DNA-binding XRE family transcriptional regulator